eukprot:6360855-Amphidinium_carterae.1
MMLWRGIEVFVLTTSEVGVGNARSPAHNSLQFCAILWGRYGYARSSTLGPLVCIEATHTSTLPSQLY